VRRHRERIAQLRPRCLVAQVGGPVGTLAAFGEQASFVVELVARRLDLGLPELPWHAHRDRVVEVATTLGLVTGTLGKIARDIALLSQSEIAEVAEPASPGRGGSSSLPQKRNPVGSAVVLAAATRIPPLVSTLLAAMPQEHERGLGGWQAEWDTLPEIFEITAGAMAHLRYMIADLEVDAEKMQANIDAAAGMPFAEAVAAALATKIGRAAAHALVERACRRAADHRQHLRDVVCSDPEIANVLSGQEIEDLFDARRHVSAAKQLVDKATKEDHR
jgi:3-carboxy-cis,cis-muconate cycloisomerase